MKFTSRRRVVAGFAAIAVPVIAASAAFACQSLATLTLSPKSGPSGTVVTAKGNNYNAAATASDVEIHLDSRTGPVVARTRAAADRSINVSFPVNASVGYHTLIATQNNASGSPSSGTPGRASFQVTQGSASADTGLPISPSTLTSPLGLAGLLLSAAALVTRRRRQASSTA